MKRHAAPYPRNPPAEKLAARPSSQMDLPTDVYETAQRVCQDYPGGIPAVAARMGVPAGTLWNKLNPSEFSHHKLTVQDVIQITLITGSLLVLQALARTLDCVCFPVPNLSNISDGALLELVTHIHQECGEWHGDLQRALADGSISAKEFTRLHKDALEWIGAIA